MSLEKIEARDRGSATALDLEGLNRDLASLPALPWKLATSCSFRRICGPDGKDGGVLSAYNQRSDGHPDLSMPEEQLFALVRLINAYPALLSRLEAAEARTQVAEECLVAEMTYANTMRNMAAAFHTALQTIATCQAEVLDNDLRATVVVSLSGDECAHIAGLALAAAHESDTTDWKARALTAEAALQSAQAELTRTREALRAAKREMWDIARHTWALADFKNWAVIQQIDAALQTPEAGDA